MHTGAVISYVTCRTQMHTSESIEGFVLSLHYLSAKISYLATSDTKHRLVRIIVLFACHWNARKQLRGRGDILFQSNGPSKQTLCRF